MLHQDVGEGQAPFSVRGRVRPYTPVSIGIEESDPWRALVAVCTVDGSCVDAARGSQQTLDSQGKEVNN